ncbi:long-chain-fatty-acid--CoA ligase [Lichenicoccus roseus]|uniref:Long-chain-fatty-acid--CoA ligase n=1 Tax=Lichenicoccus roseus TaxID=2683649 RepID=A0A5R9J6T0_9PROT|nr:long-chain-fatty-acid--CoA ligase [Lichenicoccus roseus]TLU71331.1 long-chain-fatty-acid--CoA ligase [Lichenicoccus roseus]
MALRFVERAAEAHDFPLTIRHLLDTSLVTAADQEIVYRDEVRITYRTFHERLGRLASALTALGAAEGMTIGVLDWDSHRYLECYFAIPMIGAVLQTVNVRLPPAQVAETINRAGAEILLVHRDFLPLVEALRGALPNVRAIVALMDGDAAPPDYAAGEYERLLQDADPDFEFRDFDENAMATLFFTTGTTGSPKAVCFTHRQIVLHAIVANGPFGGLHSRGFGADDVYMPLTPMFHVHAWGMPYVATMLGVKQVYAGRYDPDTILDLRAREGVTFSHCVPTILQMVLAAADRRGADLAGWLMTIGGSALTQALCREGRRRGMELVSGYGMSETAPLLTVSRPRREGGSDEVEALTMAGVPVPLVSVRVVDETMRDVPADGVSRGELVIRAPWLTGCYVGDTRASDALWRGGWLHTQDVATLNREGYVQIRDRLKDVIKTGGEWLCSVTLEDMIADLPGIEQVAVIGVPHPHWGERPLGVVVAVAGHTVTLEQVNQRLDSAIASGEVSRYARLESLELVETMPKTSVGKVDKKALRALYAAPPVASA